MQSFNLAFGQYIPGKSPLHGVDPEAKIACVAILIIFSNFYQTLASISVMLLFCVTLFLISTIPGRFILAGLKPFLWLFVLTVILQAVSVAKDHEAIFRIGMFCVTRRGIRVAFLIGGKFLLVILFSLLLITTTSPQILVKVIVRWLSPLEKLKVPVSEIGLMVMVALRFLPILQEETARVMEARKIRYSVLGMKKVPRGIMEFREILFGIFVSVLRRSQELAASMAARGYGSAPVRSWSDGKSVIGGRELLAVAVTLVVCASLFVLDRYFFNKGLM